MNDELAVKCKCNALIGYVEIIEGLEWLKMNGVIVRIMHGVCSSCGEEFHWSTSDRILERLIKRVVGIDGKR